MYSETKPWHQITEEEREGKAFLNLKSLMDLHSEIDDCVKTWKIKIHEL